MSKSWERLLEEHVVDICFEEEGLFKNYLRAALIRNFFHDAPLFEEGRR